MIRQFGLISAIFTILFIFSLPSFVFAKALDGSKIANISVEGKSEADMFTDLVDRVSDWLNDDEFILTSAYERLTIPRDIFEFDVQATVDQFQQETKRSFFSFFKKQRAVEMPLKVFIKQNHPEVEHLKSLDYIDHEQVFNQLLQQAENLEYDALTIVYHDEANLPFTKIASHHLEIPDELSFATIQNFTKDLNEQVIEPMQTFSLLESINRLDSLKNANDELSFIATQLYQVFLQSNMDIIQRKHHLQVPNYAKPGLDVLINEQEAKDFVVQNKDHAAYKIYLTLKDRELHVVLETLDQSLSYDYKIDHEKTIKPRTIYRYSNDLSPGETEVLQKGEDGLSLEVYRTTYSETQEVLNSERLSQDVYLPTPKIILASTEDAPEAGESSTETEDIEDELDEMEESILDFNQWLTGSRTPEDGEGEEDLMLRPFFYFVPGQFIPYINEQDESFIDRFEKLEEMIQSNEQLTDEVILTRLVELEARLVSLKEQYDLIVETLKENGLLNKGDE